MRAIVRVQNKNLHTGNVSIDESVIKAYWQGLLESIEVFTEDNVFVESYYGNGLQSLICSASPFRSITGETVFYLAKRWLENKNEG